MPVAKKDGRFDREAWLGAALEVLAREGQARLNVAQLAEELGVTKGSFYHHFESRSAFIRALLDYWEERFTNRQRRALSASSASPRDKLFNLMREIQTGGLTRYDTAFRSWAAQDSAVAEVVRKVDSARYSAILAIFEQIGFSGEELKLRTSTWLLSHSAFGSVTIPDREPVNETSLRRQLAFFTEPRCPAP